MPAIAIVTVITATTQTMDPDQRKQVYRSFLTREGPQKLDELVWPEPKQGALRGTKLLVTGIMETIEREKLNQLLAECSGHIMSGISKNLDILIVGRDAGPAKLQKAEQFGLRQMQEQEFYEFLKDKLDNYNGDDDTAAATTTTAKKSAAKRPKKSADGDDAKTKSPAKKTKSKK